MKRYSLLFGMALLLLSSCKNDQPKFPASFDLGEYENGVYHNNYFDLSVPLPDSFHVQSQEETNRLMNLGIEAIGETDAGFRKKLIASAVQNAYLLAAFKYPIGTDTIDFNPSIIVVAENIKRVPGVKTGKQYLENTQKLLKKADMDYSFSSQIEQQNIGGKPFAYMEGSITLGDVTITQLYFTRISFK